MAFVETDNLAQLSVRIQKLLSVLEALKAKNDALTKELQSFKKGHDIESEEKISDLEEEIRKYKRENKILKENEKLIKNKVERLSVKLDQIEI